MEGKNVFFWLKQEFDNNAHLRKHNWNQVTLASWRKYPSEDRPDVLAVDIVDKSFDPETGILSTTRVVYLQDRIPKSLQPILGGGYGICVEHTTVDPINKIMVLKSQNVSYRKIFSINEVCTYSVDKNNLNFTQLLQSAKVVAFPFGLASLIEKFSADKFRSNATQGRAIMDSAIARVVTESKEAIDCLIRETEDIFATEHLMDSMNLSKE